LFYKLVKVRLCHLWLGTHTATSVIWKNVIWPPFHTRATKYISLLSDCCTVDVACCHVWKPRLHFTFYYLMQHDLYRRRTTDVTVCKHHSQTHTS
jgi:hypothetical protein